MGENLNFENKDHIKLLNRIKKEDVILYLGAGFSMGAVSKMKDESGNHIELPSVLKLKEILCKNMLTLDDLTLSLKEMCEECKYDNVHQYENLMKDIFSVYKTADFHKKYAYVDWKKIYTVNVDDLIEKIYEENDRCIRVISSDKPVKIDGGNIPYYKLHGDVRTNPGEIIFSTSDYSVSAARKNDCRFEELMQDLKTENFLFIGTSLCDEWDFDIRCEQSDIFRIENKAFFVLKDSDERLERRLKRKFPNAVFIKETAESFIQKVVDYLTIADEGEIEPSYEKYSLRKIEKKEYLSEFYLKPNLYLGYEPTWEDIFNNHDVIWENTKSILENVFCGKKIIIISGRMVSGKTTLLYRIGANFSEDWMVLDYCGADFLKDMMAYEKDRRRKDGVQQIILFDDATWILGKIKEIIDFTERTGVYIICTVREKEYNRKQHLFDEEVSEKVNFISKIDNLGEKDILLYLDKLKEKSFLGNYSKEYNVNKYKLATSIYQSIKKKKTKEDILLSLILKKDGKDTRFKQRIEEVSNAINESKNYNIKRFIVLLYCLDVLGNTGVKISLFFEIYSMNSGAQKVFLSELQDFTISNLKIENLKNMDYSKVIVHSRLNIIIKNAIEKMNYEEIEYIVIDILRQLDSVYHFKVRQSNSYYNFIVYTLLRSQNLTELFKVNKNVSHWKYVKNIYEKLHDYYDDYHIYWLHRAIAEMKMQEFSAAQIHLEQARNTRGTYSYEIEHSFAMLNFEKAILDKDISELQKKQCLNTAMEIIRNQISKQENDAFSVHSFVVKIIEFYSKSDEKIPKDLLKEIVRYYCMAREKFNLDSSTILRNMLYKLYIYLDENELLVESGLRLTHKELKYLSNRDVIKGEGLDVVYLLV